MDYTTPQKFEFSTQIRTYNVEIETPVAQQGIKYYLIISYLSKWKDGIKYICNKRTYDPDRFNSFVESHLDRIQDYDENIHNRRQQRKIAALNLNIQVGTIFVNSRWWEQTNVDCWQVTKVIGKSMVEIRRISTLVVQDSRHSSMSEDVVPVPNTFVELRKNITDPDYYIQKKKITQFWVSFNFGACTIRDGKQKFYQSHYA